MLCLLVAFPVKFLFARLETDTSLLVAVVISSIYHIHLILLHTYLADRRSLECLSDSSGTLMLFHPRILFVFRIEPGHIRIEPIRRYLRGSHRIY